MGSKLYPHVFEPINIRGIDFKNRIWLAPPSPNLAGADGQFAPQLVNWMRMFARGGVCTLYVGNCSIDITECKDEAYQLDMNSDRCILPLTWYADMCKQYGCHASLEINHGGKDSQFKRTGKPAYAPSAYYSSWELASAKEMGREPLKTIEMSVEKIHETVEKYAQAQAGNLP